MLTIFLIRYSFHKITKVAIVSALNDREAWLSIVKHYKEERKYLKLSVTIPYYPEVNNGVLILE